MINDCKENYTRVNGVELCWFEWGREFVDRGTVLLIHATGFHARCWDGTVRHLDDRHVIAVDMRGHGRSGKVPPYRWRTFGEDVTALVRALGLERVVGAGHSMGGHSLTQAAAMEQDRFERLVLVDPVILSPESYANFDESAFADAADHPVARRRNRYDSPGAMRENLANRGSFGLWEPAVLEDYCEYGLVPDDGAGGYVLACPPLVEATIYAGSASTDIYDLIETIEIPVTVLRAAERDAGSQQMDFGKSPTWPRLAGRFANGTDVYFPALSHFLPMQAPELVARFIRGETREDG